MARRWIPVAEIARPHGVRGELRLKVYNVESDLLAHRRDALLRMPDGEERTVQIASARPVNKAMLMHLRGVDDRDAAAALRGALLCIPRDEFPPLDEGEFYACDLEGARAVLESGEEIGRVRGLRSYPTCEALEIDGGTRGAIEVPLVDAFVQEVDVENGVVRLVTIEGL
jgi:16S rRNA processing protein RimM